MPRWAAISSAEVNPGGGVIPSTSDGARPASVSAPRQGRRIIGSGSPAGAPAEAVSAPPTLALPPGRPSRRRSWQAGRRQRLGAVDDPRLLQPAELRLVDAEVA